MAMQARNQILEQFNTLSPALKRAARFVVDHPSEVVLNSMRALAEHTGMQPATLVRLAQHLGYSGWPELKKAFAGDYVLAAGRPAPRGSGLAAVRGSGSNLIADVFGAAHRNLDNAEMGNGTALHKAVRLLRRARAVHVAGFRASFCAAHALADGCRQLRGCVRLLDGQAGTLETQLRDVHGRDAVVLIDFTPYCNEALQVQQHARTVGARIVALTDSNASPLALGADVQLLFSAQGASPLPSMAAAVALTEALLALLAEGAARTAVGQETTHTRVKRTGQAPRRSQPMAAPVQDL